MPKNTKLEQTKKKLWAKFLIIKQSSPNLYKLSNVQYFSPMSDSKSLTLFNSDILNNKNIHSFSFENVNIFKNNSYNLMSRSPFRLKKLEFYQNISKRLTKSFTDFSFNTNNRLRLLKSKIAPFYSKKKKNNVYKSSNSSCLPIAYDST